MFAIWANRLLFNPDNWSNTSTQLLANPDIRTATANYLVDQLYANVNVAGLIKQGLPPQLQGLAGPGRRRAAQRRRAGDASSPSQRPRVQDLWAQANRAADQTFINVVNGGKGAVSTNNGAVTLNLGAILENVASRLGLPSGLSSKLPPNVANLTVFKAHQLKTVQNVGNAIKGLALWLTILVSPAVRARDPARRRPPPPHADDGRLRGHLRRRRRRSSGATSSRRRSPTRSPTTSRCARRSGRRSASAPQLLTEVAGAVVFVGVILVICAWFAGPGRLPRISREAIAPFLRENPWGTFAVALGILALLFIWDPIPATGTPAGIITFTVLALFGTEVLIRQTAREFPEARAGAASHAIRTRMSEHAPPSRRSPPRQRRRRRPPSSSSSWPSCAITARSRPRSTQTAKTQLLNGG